jgi:hypothetical protein
MAQDSAGGRAQPSPAYTNSWEISGLDIKEDNSERFDPIHSFPLILFLFLLYYWTFLSGLFP